MFRLILNNKFYSALVIFLFALIFRIVLINTYQVNMIAPDGTGYHTLGVNLANGNGMSMNREKPFEKYYFRELLYPAFLGACYKVYDCFWGKSNYLTSYNGRTYDSSEHPEIIFAKYMQAIVDSLSVVVFYLILLLVFKPSFAFIVSFLFGFYYPVAIHSTYLLRETIQLFITLCMAYSFAQFLLKKKWTWLIIFSGFWGLSNLTFQITVVVPFFMFIFLWQNLKNIFKSLLPVAASTMIMLIFISPWLIHIYRFYPDIRILKTFGCSFTYEMISYQNAVGNLERNQKISKQEANSLMEWGKPAYEQFRKSFDGTYLNYVRSVNKLKLKKADFNIFKVVLRNFYKSWFNTKLAFMGTKEFLKKNLMVNSVLVGIPIIIGILAFLGLFIFYRKIYPIMLTFTTFISLFYFIGSEYRRMLPATPFIYLFGCMGFYYLYVRFVLKSNNYYSILK